MSSTAIRGAPPAWTVDYEPVTMASRDIERTWAQVRNYLQGAASDWLPVLDAALRTIRKECSADDWDGVGTNAVSDRTIGLAAKVGETLYAMTPKGTPAPDIIPEGDGEVCMSWSVAPDRLLSLSVGEHGKINFAGQFAKEGAIHAWQQIDATTQTTLQKSLQDVARCIGRLFAAPGKNGRA